MSIVESPTNRIDAYLAGVVDIRVANYGHLRQMSQETRMRNKEQ